MDTHAMKHLVHSFSADVKDRGHLELCQQMVGHFCTLVRDLLTVFNLPLRVWVALVPKNIPFALIERLSGVVQHFCSYTLCDVASTLTIKVLYT